MKSQKLDAVLPLTLEDYGRFRILDKSLRLFFKDLGRCWIVTPDRQFNELESLIRDDNYSITHYSIIPESSLIPEFRLIRRKTGGWFKQQLIKIAITEKIETEFYLILDADVICTKPTYYLDLVKNNRTSCIRRKRYLYPEWYSWAKRVLGLQPLGVHHNVTPAVVSREAMIKLQEYLSQKSQEVSLSSTTKSDLALFFLGFLSRKTLAKKIFSDWKIYLIIRLPWTEFALYYTFLEATHLFDKYHYEVEPDDFIHAPIDSRRLKETFSSWNLEKYFTDRKYCFIVVQSNMDISVDRVWEKVGAYLENISSDEARGIDMRSTGGL